MHAENKNRTVQQKSCSCKNDSNPNSFVHRVILIQNEVRDEMRWSTFLFCEHRHSRLQSTRLFKHPCDKKKTSRHAIRGKDSIKLTARPTFKPVTFPVSLTFFSNLIPSPHLIRPLCPAFFQITLVQGRFVWHNAVRPYSWQVTMIQLERMKDRLHSSIWKKQW